MSYYEITYTYFANKDLFKNDRFALFYTVSKR